MIKPSTINFKTLSYLILYSVGVLLLLWLIQIIFFSVFYEKYQVNSLQSLAVELNNTDISNLETKLSDLTFESNTCAEFISLSNNRILYNNRSKGCLLGKNILNNYVLDFTSSNEDVKAYKLTNPMDNVKSLLYGVKVDTGYIFLFTMLEDVNTTTSLLKGQMIYITIIVIILSILISFFISKKLSKPIQEITSKAKQLADGNYNVHFEASDIDEINELSKALNYAEKEMSQTDNYRRDLMANVSHDLKTPLTMIKAYAEMVRDISYKDKEKRTKDLNVIIDESDRLNVLVNDILELSKLQANTAKMEIESFDLVQVLNEALKRYEIIKETENYDFVIDVPSKAMIKADKKRIVQVLYNLINNAINYTGSDKKVYVTIKEEKKYYLISIKDTGKGIAKEDIKHIWDKYYKNDKNHQRNVVGTGLGLSIVKNILQAHDFEYGVDSVINKGTTFYFKIKR